jgi:two-component system cell cycle sensor histidine kinase/response regulator CckA
VLISDHRLVGLDSFATLTIVAESGAAVPVIALVDEIDLRTSMLLVRAGAVDHIRVGHLGRLAPVVERELSRAKAERDRRQAEMRRREDEARLAQALKMESVGRLASGVAHDFNNLLAVMIGSADLAREKLGDADDQLFAALDEILSAGSRARELVRQLLAVGHRQSVDLAALDLNAVVGAALPDLRSALPATIELTTTLSPDLCPVQGDASLLVRALMNVVTNARDAMGAGGRLHIETANVTAGDDDPGIPPGGYVRLAVADSGPGMDAETGTRIFDPFFSTKDPGRGAGLGLSAVYGIVQQHGGHVRVRSEPDHGSTFFVYLPQATRSKAGDRAQADAGRRREATTVVVVEDEPAVRSLVARMLASQGYQVVEAEDGAAAIRHAGQLPELDLLVTDVMMPGLSGPQVRERIVALHPGCRVLFISGYPDHVLGEHALLVAGAPFLEKPFTLGELTTKVRRALADT